MLETPRNLPDLESKSGLFISDAKLWFSRALPRFRHSDKKIVESFGNDDSPICEHECDIDRQLRAIKEHLM